MKYLCALALHALMVLGIQGCATQNTAQSLKTDSMSTLPRSAAPPVKVKVIRATPITKPILAESKTAVAKDLQAQLTDPNPDSKPDSTPDSKTDAQTAENAPLLENTGEFQVIFEYKDQTFATVLPFDPGESLLIQGEAPSVSGAELNPATNSPGAYLNNNVYVLPPLGMPYYPYPAMGVFSAFPVYINRGFYHRIPGGHYLPPGARPHPTAPRSRAKK